jgi:hypothetical protein
MRKLLLLLLVIVFSFTQLTAQKSTFKYGDKVFDIGLGLGSSYFHSFYSVGPGLSAALEVGVADGVLDKGTIGAGGYVGFIGAKYEPQYKTSVMTLGARGSFHYPLVDKLDTYTGLMLGYKIANTHYYDTQTTIYPESSGFVLAWYIGARYYFKDNIAAMAELGYGVSILTVGISFKF